MRALLITIAAISLTSVWSPAYYSDHQIQQIVDEPTQTVQDIQQTQKPLSILPPVPAQVGFAQSVTVTITRITGNTGTLPGTYTLLNYGGSWSWADQRGSCLVLAYNGILKRWGFVISSGTSTNGVFDHIAVLSTSPFKAQSFQMSVTLGCAVGFGHPIGIDTSTVQVSFQ